MSKELRIGMAGAVPLLNASGVAVNHARARMTNLQGVTAGDTYSIEALVQVAAGQIIVVYSVAAVTGDPVYYFRVAAPFLHAEIVTYDHPESPLYPWERFSSGSVVPTNTPVRVALTWDAARAGDKLRLFVNGAVVGGGAVGRDAYGGSTVLPAAFGAYQYRGYVPEYWQDLSSIGVKMFDLRLSSVCRSDAEIAEAAASPEPFTNASGTVRLYHFTDGSGTSVTDASGHSTGVLSGVGPGEDFLWNVGEPALHPASFAVSRDSGGILIGVRDNAAPQFSVSRDADGIMLGAWR